MEYYGNIYIEIIIEINQISPNDSYTYKKKRLLKEWAEELHKRSVSYSYT